MAMDYLSDNDIAEDSAGVTYAEYMADHQETPNLVTHSSTTDKETSHVSTSSYTHSDDDDPESVSSAQDPQTQSDNYASDEDDAESSQHDVVAPPLDMSLYSEKGQEDEVEAEVLAMASAVMIISLARHRAVMLRRRQERALGLPVGNLALQFGDLAPLPCTPEMWSLLLEEFPEEEDSLW
ncbi:hypothetical protein E4U58_001454 [Claviceps cyperi]|nr:hypothetical protein E4U58_001454 [Claviceps cyperi]